MLQGTGCPASGFCGVPECGTWSSGQDDRGVPCDGAIGPTPTPESATREVPDDGSTAGISDTEVEVNFHPTANDSDISSAGPTTDTASSSEDAPVGSADSSSAANESVDSSDEAVGSSNGAVALPQPLVASATAAAVVLALPLLY